MSINVSTASGSASAADVELCKVRTDNTKGIASISVQGDFEGSVVLQRRFRGEVEWRTVDTYPDPVEENLEYGEEQELRLFTVAISSGTVQGRLSTGNPYGSC